MPVWPLLIGLSIATIISARAAGDRWAMRAGAVVLAAYAAMRAEAVIFSGGAYSDAICAAVWVAAAASIQRRGTATIAGIKVMLVLVALCYWWARVSGAAHEFGSLPYVASDLFAVMALICIGWRSHVGNVDRVCDLVRGPDRRPGHSGAADVREAQE